MNLAIKNGKLRYKVLSCGLLATVYNVHRILNLEWAHWCMVLKN